MAIITWPAGARIKTIQWTLDRPAQVNRSAWTGRRQVLANPWHGKWAAKATLVPIIGEANVLASRSFFAQLRGPVNTFRLPATEGGQAALPAAVNQGGAAAGATSMLVKRADNGQPIPALLAGHMMTSNDQLLQITAAAPDVGSGTTLVTFEPPLRAAIAGNAAVEIQNPTCLVALTGTSVGWSVDPGKLYGLTLDVEEAF